MESITTNENYPVSGEPINNATDENNLLKLFDWFSGLMLPMSDWLEPHTTIVVIEPSLQGKSAIYEVTIQNLTTITLLDTGANISVVSVILQDMQKFNLRS